MERRATRIIPSMSLQVYRFSVPVKIDRSSIRVRALEGHPALEIIELSPDGDRLAAVSASGRAR